MEHEIKHGLHEIRQVLRLIVKILAKLLDSKTPDCPHRFIRLSIVEVRFIPEPKKDTTMDNIGIDLPQGQIVRLVLAPVDKDGAAAKLDGPVTATVQGDPATAQTAVSPDGLTVDIKLPDAADSVGTVEIDGDAEAGAGVTVISTLVTVRRLGTVTGQAVTLGVTATGSQFLTADQFGTFPAARRR